MSVIRDEQTFGIMMIPLFSDWHIRRCNVKECKDKPTTIITQVIPDCAFGLCEKHYQEVVSKGEYDFTLVFDEFDAFEKRTHNRRRGLKRRRHDKMDNIATELKQEVLAQVDIIADLEAQTIAQARTIREQAVIIREHQAADVLAVEAIRSLTAGLKRMTSAIEDIKIYGNNPSAWDYYDDGVSQKICALVKAAK